MARSGSRYSLLLAVLLAAPAAAADRLLYLEAQAVGGYSSAKDRPVYYSNPSPREVMQKPSVGADFIQKLSSGGVEWGTLYFEGRLAYDAEGRRKLEAQVYNAYVRQKNPEFSYWAGHNRIPVGLESYFDTHAALLQVLSMYGAGFDRDWGVGASRDFSWGDAALSLTSGTGFPLLINGNFLVSTRVSKGVLNQENYNVGAYFSGGKVPDVTGYDIDSKAPKPYNVLGLDATYLWDRLEFRADLRKGIKLGATTYAALGRIGLNLLEENRLKLELQPVFAGLGGAHDYFLAAGAAYAVTADLSARAMFEYERITAEKRVLTQLYYYLRM